jgi:hypothetical protein
MDTGHSPIHSASDAALPSRREGTRRSFLRACSAMGFGAAGLGLFMESCAQKEAPAQVSEPIRAYTETLLALLKEVHERELPAIQKAARLVIQTKLEGHDLYAWMTGGMLAGEMSDTRPGSPLIYIKTDIRRAVRYDYVITNEPYAVKGFSERLVKVIGITKPSILSGQTPPGALENMGTFRLEDVADTIIFSHVPPADGLLALNGIDYPIGPASGIAETFLFYALTVEITEGLVKEGIYPRIA